MNTFLFLAQNTAAAPQGGGSPLGMMVPFICIGVIFYFLILRPQSQKQKALVALVNSLKTGDEIVTSGGIHGRIANVKESTVIVKIAENVKIELDKSAVLNVNKPATETAVVAAS